MTFHILEMLYLAYAVGIYYDGGYGTTRSALSKLVDNEEETAKALGAVALVSVSIKGIKKYNNILYCKPIPFRILVTL